MSERSITAYNTLLDRLLGTLGVGWKSVVSVAILALVIAELGSEVRVGSKDRLPVFSQRESIGLIVVMFGGLVLCRLIRSCTMWPLIVAVLIGRCFSINCAVNPGHVLKNPFLIACWKVDLTSEKATRMKVRCKIFMRLFFTNNYIRFVIDDGIVQVCLLINCV